MTKKSLGSWKSLTVLAIASSLPAQTLKIEEPAFRQDETGPALGKQEAFLPGEPIYFDCRVSGYKISVNEEVRSIKLAWMLRAFDPAGIPLTAPAKGVISANLADQDQEYRPRIKFNFTAPLFPWSGAHRVEVVLKDEIAGTETKLDAPFELRGIHSERTPSLSTRQWRFLRREEDDGKGLDPAVYRRGDRVWVRFYLVGFAQGDAHAHHVEYAISVIGPAGKPLFSQDPAAAEQDTPSYPARYLPGALNLELKPDSPLGAYTIEFTLRDRVSGQSAVERHSFSVE